MKKIVFLVAALLLVLACVSSKAVVDTEKDKSDLTVAKETITVKGVSFNMVTIPSGDFLMGSLSNEPNRFDNELPQRFSRPFAELRGAIRVDPVAHRNDCIQIIKLDFISLAILGSMCKNCTY